MMPAFELLAGSPASDEEWAALLAAVLQLQYRLCPPALPQAEPSVTALSPWQQAGRLEALSPFRSAGAAAFWTED